MRPLGDVLRIYFLLSLHCPDILKRTSKNIVQADFKKLLLPILLIGELQTDIAGAELQSGFPD